MAEIYLGRATERYETVFNDHGPFACEVRDNSATPTGIEDHEKPDAESRASLGNSAAESSSPGARGPRRVIQTPRVSAGVAGDSADLAVPNAETLSVEVLRRKLDAAILVEAWDAVKVIRDRIAQADRAEAGNVYILDEAHRR